jgi:hypothetical protein
MMALLVFNTIKCATFKQIVDITGLPKRELESHLLSLAHPEIAVLRKRPNTKELEDSHAFMINDKFNKPQFRIRIPMIVQASVNIEVDEKEAEAIEVQRRHQ